MGALAQAVRRLGAVSRAAPAIISLGRFTLPTVGQLRAISVRGTPTGAGSWVHYRLAVKNSLKTGQLDQVVFKDWQDLINQLAKQGEEYAAVIAYGHAEQAAWRLRDGSDSHLCIPKIAVKVVRSAFIEEEPYSKRQLNIQATEEKLAEIAQRALVLGEYDPLIMPNEKSLREYLIRTADHSGLARLNARIAQEEDDLSREVPPNPAPRIKKAPGGVLGASVPFTPEFGGRSFKTWSAQELGDLDGIRLEPIPAKSPDQNGITQDVEFKSDHFRIRDIWIKQYLKQHPDRSFADGVKLWNVSQGYDRAK